MQSDVASGAKFSAARLDRADDRLLDSAFKIPLLEQSIRAIGVNESFYINDMISGTAGNLIVHNKGCCEKFMVYIYFLLFIVPK